MREPGPDNAQLVATIKNINASAEGPVLTVADKDGDRKITIGPETAIWIARAARITDIKVGLAVTMTGVKREDGSFPVLKNHISSGRGRQSTAIAEPPCPSAQEPVQARRAGPRSLATSVPAWPICSRSPTVSISKSSSHANSSQLATIGGYPGAPSRASRARAKNSTASQRARSRFADDWRVFDHRAALGYFREPSSKCSMATRAWWNVVKWASKRHS